MPTLRELLSLATRRRLVFPAFYAVTAVLAIFLADLVEDRLAGDQWMTRTLRIGEDVLFASVTGIVLYLLFSGMVKAAGRYRVISTGTRDIILMVGSDHRIIDSNSAAEREYGWQQDELVGMPMSMLCVEGSGNACAVESVLATRNSLVVEGTHRRKDGTTFPVEVSASLGEVRGDSIVLAVVRNIADRQRRDAFAKLLHETDRRILGGSPLEEILLFVAQRVADFYPGALVQIALKQADGSVDIREYSGEHEEFLKGIEVRWDDTPHGRGPTGTAIRTGQAQYCHIATDPSFSPWRDRAVDAGFEVALAIPLMARDRIHGALTLFCVAGEALDNAGLGALQAFADQVALSISSGLQVEKLALQGVALDSAANAVVVTNPDGIVEWVNPAFTELTGFRLDEARGKRMSILKSGSHEPVFYRRMWETIRAGKVWHGEVYNRKKDGTLYLEEQTVTPVTGADGAITHYVAIKQDVTVKRRQEEQIRHLTMHDPLTGLPNRRLLVEHLGRVVKGVRGGEGGALLVMDIDHFQAVNEALGHAAGDELLRQLGALLAATVRPDDVAARFGGDGLAVVLERSRVDEAREAAERVRHAFETHLFRFGSSEMSVTASIGVAPFSGGEDPDALLALGDAALCIAKEQGRNRVVVCDPDEARAGQAGEAGLWAARVREALKDGGLVLAYQPVVELTTGSVAHYEALLRMKGENGELIGPDQFLRAAERFGLMPQIDRWVVDEVTRLLARRSGFKVFVNLSALSLADEGLIELISERISELGIAPGRLAFEITETTAIADFATARNWIGRVKALGCLFALDDFGVGFSSLSYLRVLAVDYVKIDRSFIADLHTDTTSRALVQAVKSVATTLGKGVIAEGVECEAHTRVLTEIGIEHGQGFYWGLPSPVLQFHPEPNEVVVN